MKYIIVIMSLSLIVGCANEYGSINPGYWKPASIDDPEASFGIFIEALIE